MSSTQAAQKSSRAPAVQRLCLLEDDNQALPSSVVRLSRTCGR